MTTTALINRNNTKPNINNNNNNSNNSTNSNNNDDNNSKNNLSDSKCKIINRNSTDAANINKMPHSLNSKTVSISDLANATITATTTTTPPAVTVTTTTATITTMPATGQHAINTTCSTTSTTTNSPISTANTTTAAATTTSTTTTTSLTRTMQTDEDFNIRFVNLVRSHKCLYDKKVPEYRNRDNQEKAWLQISQQTKESVIHCKERWRNLRACLSRYIKQQSGADPQHKPYYLTEHMAFLFPFLKSTRNSLDGNSSLAILYQYSQQQQQYEMYQSAGNKNNENCINVVIPIQQTQQTPEQLHQLQQLQQLQQHEKNLQFNEFELQHNIEVKHSLSDNDDEETIDAFEPTVTATLQLQCTNLSSPGPSDTASANTLQNFIPDVQLSELRTPDVSADPGFTINGHSHGHGHGQHHNHQHHHPQHHLIDMNDTFNETHEPKRFKSECQSNNNDTVAVAGVAGGGGNSTTQLQFYCGEQADMEFFRSILPDIAYLTPQQKRKLKIGILELIDDVIERYPLERQTNTTASSPPSQQNFTSTSNSCRNSTREWRNK